MLRLAPPFLSVRRVLSLQLIQDTWGKTRIDDVVRQVPKESGQLHVRCVFHFAKAAEFLEVLQWKCPDPLLKFLGDKCLKDSGKCIALTIHLVARGFINKSNNPDASKTSCEDFASGR